MKSATYPLEITLAEVSNEKKDFKILTSIKVSDQSVQASKMFYFMLDKILHEHDLKLQDIEALFVVDGPGSFTGARVGLTFAKTLAIIHDNLQCFRCNELDILEVMHEKNTKNLCIIKARKNTYYVKKEKKIDIVKTADILAKVDEGYTLNGISLTDSTDLDLLQFDLDYYVWLQCATLVENVIEWEPYYYE